MTTIVISPHLDDAVFSCGGMIAYWCRQGEVVTILTIFSASPPPGVLSPFAKTLHDRWGLGSDPLAGRRQEDTLASERLGCGWQHLEFPDCIYRSNPVSGQPVIDSAADLFAPVQEGELPLIHQVAQRLAELVPSGARVLSPLGVGGHVDHRIARAAVESLGVINFYYADFPYSAAHPETVTSLLPDGSVETLFDFRGADIANWQHAAWHYRSQISSFWVSQAVMEDSIFNYAQGFGKRLWTIPLGHQL
jgi:LmbE family N-acetylglucosaminyl deacetylase